MRRAVFGDTYVEIVESVNPMADVKRKLAIVARPTSKRFDEELIRQARAE